MRAEIEAHEPERDPALAAALRAAYAEAPLSPERGDALRRRIRERALALGSEPAAGSTVAVAEPRRQPRSWKAGRLGAGWRRPVWAVPALLAATVAAVLLLDGRGARTPPPPPPPPAAIGFGSAEQALSAELSDAEFARVVTGQDDPAALLALAVQPPAR